MHCSIVAMSLVLELSVACAAFEARDEQFTPAQQFQALLKEFETASSSGKVLSDAERMQFIGVAYQRRHQLALKFVELAEKYPHDPVAVDALMQAVWQVNSTPWPVELVGKDEVSSKALELLQRGYLQSDKLGSVCQRISFGFRKEYESFFRAVLAKSPHREVRAIACVSLGHYLSSRVQRLDLMQDEPKLAREFAGLFGDDYLANLKRRDRGAATREAEGFFEQALRDYGDVTILDQGTIGKKAQAELFEIRHLIAGKPAPDIEGDDQDGKRFKLSDYRGKVVLLDFWSEY